MVPAPVTAATGVDGLSYVVLLPPEDECLSRLAGRSGHGFTYGGATRRMPREFTDADVEAGHVLIDPPGPPPAVARSILARLASGALGYVP